MSVSHSTSAVVYCDRDLVRSLHQAYADKSESFFTGLKKIPGDPCEVLIQNLNGTRICCGLGHDWLNRATLNGDESFALIEQIIEIFQQRRHRCHFEWNPGNCYRPGSWNEELGRHLLGRGFVPGGFRCVWVARLTNHLPAIDDNRISIRRYGSLGADQYLSELQQMTPEPEPANTERKNNVLYGQSDSCWSHYIGELNGQAGSHATLFIGDRIACLDWGSTLPNFHRQGLHQAMIRQRMLDASQAGCDLAFAVTDIGIPSSINLQRAGFVLAYNYVMLMKDPPR